MAPFAAAALVFVVLRFLCTTPLVWLPYSVGLLVLALGLVLVHGPCVRRWAAVGAAALLLVDWIGCFGCRTTQPLSVGDSERTALHFAATGDPDKKTAAEKQADAHQAAEAERKRAFLKAQYDTAVKELEQRAENERTLFILKFTLVGAILGALFVLFKGTRRKPMASDLRQSSLVAAFFWAAVLVAATLDVRIQFNVVFISKLGDWVAGQEEAMLAKASHLGWEHYLSGMFHSGFYPLLRMSATLLTLILFAVTVTLFAPRADGVSAESGDATLGRELGLGGGLAAFVMFAFVSRAFQTSDWAWLHSASWAGVGYLSLWLSVKEAPQS